MYFFRNVLSTVSSNSRYRQKGRLNWSLGDFMCMSPVHLHGRNRQYKIFSNDFLYENTPTRILSFHWTDCQSYLYFETANCMIYRDWHCQNNETLKKLLLFDVWDLTNPSWERIFKAKKTHSEILKPLITGQSLKNGLMEVPWILTASITEIVFCLLRTEIEFDPKKYRKGVKKRVRPLIFT